MECQTETPEAKRHVGTVRRILQRCASIAGAHSAQAAIDIRRAFRVEPVFGPRRIYIAAGDPASRAIFERGDLPVIPVPYLSSRLPGGMNLADFAARYCVPLLLDCDGLALPEGWSEVKLFALLHDTAERYQIPIEIV